MCHENRKKKYRTFFFSWSPRFTAFYYFRILFIHVKWVILRFTKMCYGICIYCLTCSEQHLKMLSKTLIAILNCLIITKSFFCWSTYVLYTSNWYQLYNLQKPKFSYFLFLGNASIWDGWSKHSTTCAAVVKNIK